ncbi:MAG: SH3 domain-containing protein, partial [Anaerolineae bacterium]|nr:SH3 domain-containing protein [Anaerolineae bacterium]
MKYILIAAAILLLMVTSAAAQVEDCPATVASGISAAANNCANLGPNEICYGHADVSAIVNCEEALEFDTAGDTIPLNTVCALRLSPLQSSGEWGVAVMSVRPSTYPANITYALFGDIEIQNASSDVFALNVWATKDADVRAGPGSHFEVVGILNQDETVEANACNCTGNWLRITMGDGHIGWISAMDVSVLGESGDLPVVEADT